jgi:hypothetical protein
MSQTNETATETVAVFTREDGTMYTEAPFSLKVTKEVADRFRGDHTVSIPLPVAAPDALTAGQFLADGVLSDGLTQTLLNLAAFVAPEANFAEVLVGKFNGQGIRLDIQKEVKDFLAPRPTDDTETVEENGEQVLTRNASVETMLAAAQQVARDFRLGTPRKKGTGAAKGKVAAAEAKAAKAIGTAVSMYAALPVELRAMYREQLIATGSVTAEELDAVDASDAGVGSAGGNEQRKRR